MSAPASGTPDFSTTQLQRDWHSQWPRWINCLLAYRYVSQTTKQESKAGQIAVVIGLRWLRGFATAEECRQAMRDAYAIAPVRGGKSRSAEYAASVAACAANRYPDTAMVYAAMCITNPRRCEQLAAELIQKLGYLTGPDDQQVAMDQLEELGLIEPVD